MKSSNLRPDLFTILKNELQGIPSCKEPGKKLVFIVGRHDWQKDQWLNKRLFEHLNTLPVDIKWEDPAAGVLLKFERFLNKRGYTHSYVKRLGFNLIRFYYACVDWNYCYYLYGRRKGSLDIRCITMNRRLKKLSRNQEVIILSRSAGGRASSLIADELNIRHIICLGYPFKHPNKEQEPERYQHLANLKTNMLILQGKEDIYGGWDMRGKYNLSTSIELEYIDTDHDFITNEAEWNNVLANINKILN